jgi:hypothetical protein
VPFWHVTIIQLDTPLAAAIPNNQRNKILILLRWENGLPRSGEGCAMLL